MNTYDFIALDVETATSSTPRFICQIGLAYVKDGEIVKKSSHLIQPPENHIEPILTKIHNISSANTLSASLFPKVWESINEDLLSNKIVAHNASFDQSVIKENLDYYGISDTLSTFECTYKIFKQGLKDLCMGFGMSYTNHHNACFDAECCAQFYLNYLDDKFPKNFTTQAAKKSNRKKKVAEMLEQNLEADSTNPFYKKKIVVTGTFSVDRSQLTKDLAFLGGKIISNISGATNIVVKGESPGPSKIKKMEELLEQGKDIEILDECALLEALEEWK